MMDVCCIRDMLEDGSFEYDPTLEALGGEPWQVKCCVDADRGEASSRVHLRRELGFG